jgi:replication-associated recombination protein RarA
LRFSVENTQSVTAGIWSSAQANFIIATQRSRCAEDKPVVLIDEVKRFDRTFAWVYARPAEN